MTRFAEFDRECAAKLPEAIGEILGRQPGRKPCAIGFVTTDDFYGCYLTWAYVREVAEYYSWEQGLEPDFLYQPLVDVVDACKDIDLCVASAAKWGFAMELLAVLAKNIKGLPEEVFAQNGYRREDVTFFATMGDGDYVQEMLEESLALFNEADAEI